MSATSATIVTQENTQNELHVLNDRWDLWYHLPQNNNWEISGYVKIGTYDTAEGIITAIKTIPETILKMCMFFLVRSHISPRYEDVRNINGGYFSYKVSNKDIGQSWEELCYALVGETLSNDPNLMKNINAVSISPKKGFCIEKIWLSTCNYQNPEKITTLIGIFPKGCIFSKWGK